MAVEVIYVSGRRTCPGCSSIIEPHEIALELDDAIATRVLCKLCGMERRKNILQMLDAPLSNMPPGQKKL